MQQKIVLIGNSPLTFFVARELDSLLANLVQFKVIWLTTEKSLPSLSWNGYGNVAVPFKKQLENVRVVQTEVKSISLKQKHIITARGVVSFDFLLIDQAPYYKAKELEQIVSTIEKLALSVKASLNQGKEAFARVVSKAANAETIQLMLFLDDYIESRHKSSSPFIDVSLDIKADSPDLKRFLYGLSKSVSNTKSKISTITIEAPKPMVDLAKVRGLHLTEKGEAMTERGGFVLDYPNVIILNEQARAFQNLVSVQKTLSSKLTKSVKGFFEGVSHYADDHKIVAYKLKHNKGIFVVLGDMVSAKITASLLDKLDQRLVSKNSKKL